MSKEFQDIVNAPHKAFGRARKKLEKTNPKDPLTQTARVAGIGITGLSQFILWATKYAVLDNHLLRKLEDLLHDMKVGKDKQGNKKKLSSFMKKYPNFSAHLIYYLGAVSAFTGCGEYGRINDGNADDVPTPPENVLTDVPETGTLDAGNGKFHVIDVKTTMLDPKSDNFIDQCIALENIVSVPIVYTETYRAIPVVQPKENVWTHGFGMTWSRNKQGKMKIRDYADTPANRKKGYKPHKPAVNRTMNADLEETQQFLRDQVYPEIKKHLKRKITVNEFLGLCTAGYQLTGHIDDICKNLNKAKTPREIADAFITPSMFNYGGTPKRRWVCGMLAAGYISLDDMLNADVDAFYKADLNTFMRGKKHFIINDQTIEYVLGLKKQHSTQSIVSKLDDGKIAMKEMRSGVYGKIKIGKEELNASGEEKISKSMATMIDAQKAYDAKDYKKAAELFNKAIKQDPDNMEAYSSLALAYKKLGDKNNSIDYYEKALDVVVLCNNRMNANRDLLMDHDVKASLYYNAGTAREKMADVHAKRGDKMRADKNYELAMKNYQTALENCKNGDNDPQKIEIYNRVIKKLTVRMNKKSRRNVAGFKNATGKIKLKMGGSEVLINPQMFGRDNIV